MRCPAEPNPAKADKVSAAATTAFPALGGNHGYSVFLAGSPGPHTVCLTGTTENHSYGCRTVTVPPNEVGFFDTAVGVAGGAAITGWSLDQSKNLSTYVWVTVDGANGRPVPARNTLNWVAGLYPGIGSNHGFATTIPTTPGNHTICITGTQENVSYGCKDVTVPLEVLSSVDSVEGVAGGVQIAGWAAEKISTKTLYFWVTIDGSPTIVPANKPLSWINNYLPGAGPNHGVNALLPATSGSHEVCITLTSGNVPLGCSTVVVP